MSTKTPGTQTSLDSIDYTEDDIVTKPDESRITAVLGDDIWDDDELNFDYDQGTVFWIDGTEYVLATYAWGILKRPPVLIDKNGNSRKMGFGTLPQTPDENVYLAWVDDIKSRDETDEDEPTITKSNTLATADEVYLLETNTLEYLHRWVADQTENRNLCPHCNERGSNAHHVERQGKIVAEIRVCTNSDCNQLYRYVHEYPDPEATDILLRDGQDGDFKFETVEGPFDSEEQDDFKFPVETHDGIPDGIYSSKQLAEFTYKQLLPNDIAKTLPNGKVSLPTITNHINKDDLNEFARLIAKNEEINIFHPLTKTKPTLEPTNREGTETSLEFKTRDLITTEGFGELFTRESNFNSKRVVKTRTNYSGDTVVVWKDAPQWDKMMSETFTQIREHNTGITKSTLHMLNHKGVDFDEYSP